MKEKKERLRENLRVERVRGAAQWEEKERLRENLRVERIRVAT